MGRMLRAIALVSFLYDVGAGLALIFLRPQLPAWFALPAPPPIYADLIALFLIVVGIGFLLPLIQPLRFRPYLWIFGVLLKGAGAALFIAHYRGGGAPPSYLLFAVSDGLIAMLTLGVLLVATNHVITAVEPRRALWPRRVGTTLLAKLMLPFAVLRVATAEPPVDRNAGQNDQ
jgi:hypothetical protein